jgi:uncharacterized protein (TIGR03435 family)
MRRSVCALLHMICMTLPVNAQTPNLKPTFEVASVRPAKNQINDPTLSKALREATLRSGQIPTTGGDRVHLENWPLLDLIAAAYGVRVTQVSGPAWLSSKSFDIEATLQDGNPDRDRNAMLQSLLEDRFSLKARRLTQTKQGYALIVGKGGPKLRSADLSRNPTQKLTEKEQEDNVMQTLMETEQRMKSSAAAGYNIASWSSITLQELAHILEQFINLPVDDETGLKGKYSVTLDMSTDVDGSRSSVFSAIKDLGLKLEPCRVPTEILVIDKITPDPTPT